MCNRAQSRPRKWAVAMGSTTEPIGSRSGEVLSASPSRASIPSLGLRCSQPRLRGTGCPARVRGRRTGDLGDTVELGFMGRRLLW